MNKNKGFSLIELLIAVTLLSIIMLMVSQFMSNTSWALTKAKKNQNIQTEAMEVGSQFTDVLMQATYIRVKTQDGKIYELNTNMGAGNKKLREITAVDTIGGDLVVDNYPNYLNHPISHKIILDESDYTLVEEDGTPYQANVFSFRKLTQNRASNAGAKSLYVKPKYIYMQYMKKDPGVPETVGYVIYYFEDNKVYMNRPTLSGATDGFDEAIASLGSNASLVTDNMSDCYFSADTEANTVFLDMLFENEKFEGYTYNYVEAIVLRNSNVLTVPPQQMYKLP